MKQTKPKCRCGGELKPYFLTIKICLLQNNLSLTPTPGGKKSSTTTTISAGFTCKICKQVFSDIPPQKNLANPQDSM